MKKFDYPILATEGKVHLTVSLFMGCIATWFFGWWSAPIWVIVLFVFQFFRDPKRSINQEPGVVVAPASGKVISIGQTENPFIEGMTSMKVSIFMNVFSVHSNLIPIAGNVKKTWYFPGKFFNAAVDKASSENERNAVWIQTDQGDDIVSVQIAGLIARRILCYVDSGDSVETGQRYGFIRFGSRVDLYLPVKTKLTVQLGEWVSSGNNIIGRLER